MLKSKKNVVVILVLSLIGLFVPQFRAFAQSPDTSDLDGLFDLSIEELMHVEVTTASKKEERLFETAVAAYVLTSEDIRRSGATSIMDALRMVPGLHVARMNANKWAISSRGFNGEFADKMLVMIDGRSIYTPHFGGVRWDTYDVMLEDIERIEIIRGPGGTLWGGNAVNGIINIITKHAKDTQGLLLTGGGGTEEQGFGAVRYGDKMGKDTYLRVYSKYFNRGDGTQMTGSSGQDGWDVTRGGFRIDHDSTNRDEWIFLGDIYDGDVGQLGTEYSLTAPISQAYSHENTLNGGNLLVRWKRILSFESDVVLQAYYNRERRLEKVFSSTLNTYDIDFQHRFPLSDRHEMTWGLGSRLDRHTLDGSFDYSLNPRHEDLGLHSVFVQDKISLIPDRLELTFGTKVLQNEYTDLEFQPSARLLWKPNDRHTVWGAVTRAAKTPSRHDIDGSTSWGVFSAGPSIISQEAYGSRHLEAEEVTAFELGYRIQPADELILDLTGFFNDYEEILASERQANIAMPGYTIWPNLLGNNLHAETYGIELSATYQASRDWRLNAGYTFLQIQAHPDQPSITRDVAYERQSPHNQFQLCSQYDLTKDLELDCAFNYVDNVPDGDIPHYLRFDARLGWHMTEHLELSVVGQNLLDSRHPEFGAEAGQIQTEAERGAYVKVTYRF